MLGALLKTTHVVSLDSLSQSLEEVAFRDAALGKNIEAVRRGYEETQVYDLNG
jgi:pyruvate ferredoxin oxidoreductase gamma subunit/phenylglyoxylate dehydrogenase gamma subunit